MRQAVLSDFDDADEASADKGRVSPWPQSDVWSTDFDEELDWQKLASVKGMILMVPIPAASAAAANTVSRMKSAFSPGCSLALSIPKHTHLVAYLAHPL